jgi:hypothetical protein
VLDGGATTVAAGCDVGGDRARADIGRKGERLLAAVRSSGTGDGQFSALAGVAVDPASGDVYVVDSLDDLVQKFSSGLTTCNALSTSTGEGLASEVQLDCFDAKGLPVSYAIDSGPSHGTLGSLTAPAQGTTTVSSKPSFRGAAGTAAGDEAGATGVSSPRTFTIRNAPAVG